MKEARPFRITDGMILVAATAVGLATSKWITPPSRRISMSKFAERVNELGDLTIAAFETVVHYAIFPALPTLAAWSTACFFLHFSKDRPPIRRLLRRPGFVASLISCVMVVILLLFWSVGMLAHWKMVTSWSFGISMFSILSLGLTPGIGCCWMYMWLVGSWRPVPTWLDRLERSLGVVWLVSTAIFVLSVVVNP